MVRDRHSDRPYEGESNMGPLESGVPKKADSAVGDSAVEAVGSVGSLAGVGVCGC